MIFHQQHSRFFQNVEMRFIYRVYSLFMLKQRATFPNKEEETSRNSYLIAPFPAELRMLNKESAHSILGSRIGYIKDKLIVCYLYQDLDLLARLETFPKFFSQFRLSKMSVSSDNSGSFTIASSTGADVVEQFFPGQSRRERTSSMCSMALVASDLITQTAVDPDPNGWSSKVVNPIEWKNIWALKLVS